MGTDGDAEAEVAAASASPSDLLQIQLQELRPAAGDSLLRVWEETASWSGGQIAASHGKMPGLDFHAFVLLKRLAERTAFADCASSTPAAVCSKALEGGGASRERILGALGNALGAGGGGAAPTGRGGRRMAVFFACFHELEEPRAAVVTLPGGAAPCLAYVLLAKSEEQRGLAFAMAALLNHPPFADSLLAAPEQLTLRCALESFLNQVWLLPRRLRARPTHPRAPNAAPPPRASHASPRRRSRALATPHRRYPVLRHGE